MKHTLTSLLASVALALTCQAQPDWTQIRPTTSPAPRDFQGMAFNFFRQHTVMFGGRTGGGTLLNDTWTWDGKNWTQLKPANAPSIRWAQNMVLDFGRQRVVLFGGRNASVTAMGDTWEWDGRNWTQIKPTTSPPARAFHMMAYDNARKRTVLFGGSSNGANSGALNDTWEWDGTNWTKMSPTTSPAVRAVAAMTFDSTRNRTVLFAGSNTGGNMNDTWEYDGKTWTQIKTANAPAARSYPAMTYDQSRQRSVMYGGNRRIDTWEYDGKNWTQIQTKNSPPGRPWTPPMAYDFFRRRTVLFGGSTTLADTWEYGGQTTTLTASPATISIASGGTQTFTLNAGSAQASRLYWLFGSLTGTSPGVTLASGVGSVTIPLNPDIWTDITIAFANSAFLVGTRGTLSSTGGGQASFVVPKMTNQSSIGVRFHHAYLVYDAQSNFYMASNPVELTLVK